MTPAAKPKRRSRTRAQIAEDNAAGVKPCSKCGEILPFSAFNKNRRSGDGLQGNCRECSRATNKQHHADKPEHYADKQRRYRVENREKYLAHKMVENAVRKGKLVKPEACEVCMAKVSRLDAHHDDYAQPLLVAWVYRGCHRIMDELRDER